MNRTHLDKMSMTAKARDTRLYSNRCPRERISKWANARDVTCVVLLQLRSCFRPVSQSDTIRLNPGQTTDWCSTVNYFPQHLTVTQPNYRVQVDDTWLGLREMFINVVVKWLRAQLLLWRQSTRNFPISCIKLEQKCVYRGVTEIARSCLSTSCIFNRLVTKTIQGFTLSPRKPGSRSYNKLSVQSHNSFL
jgi:hypothetical protein